VIDPSALAAILDPEAEAAGFLLHLSRPGPRTISSATLLEAQPELDDQRGEAGDSEHGLPPGRAQIGLIPLLALQMHRAGPIQGDGVSYGLDMAMGATLLLKSEALSPTDVRVAL